MNPRLYWQIYRLAFLLEKLADASLKSNLGIGFAQYKVLEAINQNALARQNVIAEMLDQTEASISRQIKILQGKGLITVSFVMGNKRAKELGLTHIGEEIVSNAEAVLDVAQAEVMDSLNYQEQRLLQDILERMLTKTNNN
jgi:DNA-binding MarR family transcriptional regulator